MVAESFAILVVCFLLVVAFMRSRFAKSVVAVLPIAIIPAAYLVIRAIQFAFRESFFGIRIPFLGAFLMVLALGITCAVIVKLGGRIGNKPSRRVYYCVTIGYSVVIGWVYIFYMLRPLLG